MMRWIYKLPLRLRSLFRKNRVEDDLSVELRFHLEKQIEQNVATGMSAEEARYAALRAFGGVEQAKEECRDAWSVRFINEIAQDLRYGLRQLRRSPGFTAVAVLTLALGIGANVAIFSLINQTLLRSLPVQHPNQLVVLSSTELKAGTTDAEYSGAAIFSYPMYKDLRENNRAFSGLLASYPHADVNVSWHGQAERASAELVSGNFFQVLGVRPALGRVFSQADETAPGANPVVVLSYGYWKRHFGGGPAVLNQTLDINATDLTVAGVAQAGFTGDEAGAAPDLYVPITMNAQMAPNGNRLNEVSDYFLALIGRLKPGMSRLRAQAELQPAFHAILEAELPIVTANKDIISAGDRKRFLTGKIELTPGAQGRPVLQTFLPAPMAILMGMVGLVLLIACANLASLLLARGEARQHEIAVRLAVGASRSRLIRQLLTEGLILAVAGGGAGLLIGWWTLRLIIYALPEVPLVAVFLSGVTANLEPHVLVFCAGATILSLQFFGLLPALKASRADLQTSLKEQGASTSGGAGSVRLRKLLVVGQVGSAVTLLVAAGLFGESLVRLERENVGMRIDHVVQFSIDPGLGGYSPAKTVALFNRLRRNIAALPGVSSVAAAQVPLLAGSNTSDTMKFQDFAPAKNVDTTVGVNYVSPRFFSTLGTPLIEGREFRASDSASSPQVAIINEKVAREFFPGHNPVGMHLAIGSGPDVHPNIEIAGVVANTKNVDPSDPVVRLSISRTRRTKAWAAGLFTSARARSRAR